MGSPTTSSATLSRDATGEELLRVDAEAADTEALLDALRAASSREALAREGIPYGFRVEDLIALDLATPGDPAREERWLRRRLPKETAVRVSSSSSSSAPPRMRGIFARRGHLPTSQRRRYEQADGRVRVEAFELHVVEHCNLGCAHCCNMSPYLAEKVLSPDEIERQCRFMARHLEVDVFKIMGGEPLLHPQIAEVLRVIRGSRISETIRLFTNGLLLHRMGDDFWRALDQLTISSYSSAPVKPELLALARRKARDFDVVLNVKPVSQFSEVMRAEREDDDGLVKRTYDDCWLRHRCLVVRGGRFFKCTRAAYAGEFHDALARGAREGDRERALAEDSIALDAPDFGDALLRYLNREDPLASCRFCHGSEGPLIPHEQLTRRDVAERRLRRLPRAPA